MVSRTFAPVRASSYCDVTTCGMPVTAQQSKNVNCFRATYVEYYTSARAPPKCYPDNVMSIPNVKRYRITSPDGNMSASLMAVLPKNVDVAAYLSDAAKRFDWKAYQEAQQKQFKIRVGQQKQKKAK